MTAVEVIERVIAAKFLSAGLTFIPDRGVSPGDLAQLQAALGRKFSLPHLRVLQRWAGLNLDVVRIYGAEETRNIRGLCQRQEGPLSEIPGVIVFADDPAGFSYGEAPNGNVLVYDSDGQTVKTLAADMDDFFSRLVFGVDAKDFAGADWFAELKAARIVI